MPKPVRIAYFVTPHGFGHASRAAAVMAAVTDQAPHVTFEILTTCPKEIFSQSLQGSYGYHPMDVDIGVIQTSPLHEDLAATCKALDNWLPLREASIHHCAQQLKKMACVLAVCDISPMGIKAAAKAGIPSLLVENFTWDWIYDRYTPVAPCLVPHSSYLQTIYRQVDYRIQTHPLCQSHCDALTVAPISRKPRTDRTQTRKKLTIENTDKMILVTMGGVPDQSNYLASLPTRQGLYFVIPGTDGLPSPNEHIILLPTHGSFFHPDLILAADLIIGKVGYSTIAEIYQSGTPFGYVARPQSPESDPLEKFIKDRLSAQPIAAQAFDHGEWIDQLPQLLTLPRHQPAKRNGADQVADFICKLIAQRQR